MTRFAMVMVLIAVAVQAFAGIPNVEPSNNTRAGAAPSISLPTPWADVGILTLTPNDTDFIKIWLNAGEVFTASTHPLDSLYDPDTVIALFDGVNPTAVVWDDDSGYGLGSTILWQSTVSGWYYLAITGYHVGSKDQITFYEGATHSEDGRYILTISAVPEPASLLTLGWGLQGCSVCVEGAGEVFSDCSSTGERHVVCLSFLHCELCSIQPIPKIADARQDVLGCVEFPV